MQKLLRRFALTLFILVGVSTPTLADEPTESTDPLAADAMNLSGIGYCWLRPLSDWRLAGGTATPRLVSMSITGRDLAELGGRVAPMADRLASSEMRHGAAGS